MIHEPVFQDPGSLRSLLQRAEARLAARERLPDLEVAMIIEKHLGKALPAPISHYLTKHFRGEIKGVKGPKLQSDATKDFRFGPAANLYGRVLPIFEYLAQRRKRVISRRRNTKTGSGYRDETLTPRSRALEYVLENRPEPDDLGSISARALANAISEWHGKLEPRDFPDDDPNAHPTDEPASDTSRKMTPLVII
jgi:hypothetical protein